MSENQWAVFRQDFTGNEFLVERNLTEERARELVIVYESHKHHQHYWACEIQDAEVDFSAMLRASLGSGSSMESSLKVLRNQKASISQCIQAVQEARDLDLENARSIVLSSGVFSVFDQGGSVESNKLSNLF